MKIFALKQVHSSRPDADSAPLLLIPSQVSPSLLSCSASFAFAEYGGKTRLFGRHLQESKHTFREVMVTSFKLSAAGV